MRLTVALFLLGCPALLAAQAPQLDSTRTTAATPEIVSLYYSTPGDTVRKTDTLRDTLRLYCHIPKCPAPNPFSRDSLPSSGGGTVTLGIPFGPYSAWSGSTISVGAPFTAGMGGMQPQTLTALFQTLDAKQFGGFVNPFGGGAQAYLTNGRFDLTKWRAKLAEYQPYTAAIQGAYATGRLRGLIVLDEPHNPKWGGGLTKATVDQMCREVTATLGVPAGVTHQHDLFSPSTPYTHCSFLVNQYVHRKTGGDVVRYRDAALAWAQVSKLSTVFSLNVLDGGIQGRPCGANTGGDGTFAANCRMTPEQIRDWGKLLGPAGCALLMWRYEADLFTDPSYLAAFAEVAQTLAILPRKGCVRT